MRNLWLILAILLLIGNFQTAWAKPKVYQYQLKNGLILLVKPDHRAPVAVSQVWYKVGSSYESNGITGISHVLEHMMFRGSKKYGPGVFSQIIAENGGEQNAFTSDDYTAYYEEMAANKLPISFKLEADRMQHLEFKKSIFDKELQVVLEERRMRLEDNPQSMTLERLMAAAFLANPYHHPTIGWLNDLENLQVSDLKHWYQSWYGPNNAIVVVVGDVEPKQVLKLAKATFGKLKPIQITAPKPRKSVAPLGERQVIVERPAKLPWIVMGFNVPSLVTAKDKTTAYALTVAAAVLSAGDAARIPEQLIRGQQILASGGADYDPYRLHSTLFLLYGTPANGKNIAEVKSALLNEVAQLQTTLVSQQALDRIKAQVIAEKIYAEDSISTQATELGSLVAIGLPWQTAFDFVKNIEKITPQQVQAAAKIYFNSQRLTVAELKPLPLHGQTIQQEIGLNHVQ